MLVWCKQRKDWVYLVVSCSAVAGAGLSVFELGLLHAQTTAQYLALLGAGPSPYPVGLPGRKREIQAFTAHIAATAAPKFPACTAQANPR